MPLAKIHPSYHFYTYLIGIILGIILSSLFEYPLCHSFLWLLFGSILLVTSIKYPLRATLLVALFSGLLIGNFRVTPDLETKLTLREHIGRTVTVTGQISADPDVAEGTTAVKLDHLELANGLRPAGTLYIKLSAEANLERSDYLTLTGKLNPGFGTFVGSLSRPKIEKIEKLDPPDPFVKSKNAFAATIHRHIPSPAAELGLGYLMGLKTGLPSDFSDALRLVGMTHVIVASGAHLGIIVGLVKKLTRRISRFASLFFSLLLILGFALVVGFTPSMTRAALVASLSLLVGYVGRRFTPLRLILFVMALTLLLVPENFQNLGWQLSFASFFGIMIIAPCLNKFLYGGKTPPWLAGMLITSFSASLVCAPILILNFGIFSLLGFVANLVILPTLPYAMLLVFLTGLTSPLPLLPHLFAFLVTLLLNFHIWLINFLSTKTMFILEFSILVKP